MTSWKSFSDILLTTIFVAGSKHGSLQDSVRSPRNIPTMVKRSNCSYTLAETQTLPTSTKSDSQGREMVTQGNGWLGSRIHICLDW